MKAKLENIWYHYRTIIIVAALALVAGGYMLFQQLASPDVDYTIGIISLEYVPDGARAQLREAVAERGVDLTEDGRVVVDIRAYQIALGVDGQDSTQISALDADLVGKLSGVFLLDDPAAFEAATNGVGRAEQAVRLEEYPVLCDLLGGGKYALLREDVPHADDYATVLAALRG